MIINHQLAQHRARYAFDTVAPADVVLHRWRRMFEAGAAVVEPRMFQHRAARLTSPTARLIDCRMLVGVQ